VTKLAAEFARRESRRDSAMRATAFARYKACSLGLRGSPQPAGSFERRSQRVPDRNDSVTPCRLRRGTPSCRWKQGDDLESRPETQKPLAAADQRLLGFSSRSQARRSQAEAAKVDCRHAAFRPSKLSGPSA